MTTGKKDLVDFGEKVIAEAAKDGQPAFSYVQAGPETLSPRPLSPEEREWAKRSSLSTVYVPPSKRSRS